MSCYWRPHTRSGWWYEFAAIRKSVPKISSKQFDLSSWLADISCQASQKLFQENVSCSAVAGKFSLDDILAHGQLSISRVLSALEPSSSGPVHSLICFQDLLSNLFNSALHLSDELSSQLPDLICDCFQQFLSHLNSGALPQAQKCLTLYARLLPLIALRGEQPGVCEEIDAMDKYGKWYQAFVIKRSPESYLVHFMVSGVAFFSFN